MDDGRDLLDSNTNGVSKPKKSSDSTPTVKTKQKNDALPSDPVARARALRAKRQGIKAPARTLSSPAASSPQSKKGSMTPKSAASPQRSNSLRMSQGASRTQGARPRRDHLARKKKGIDDRLKNFQDGSRTVHRTHVSSPSLQNKSHVADSTLPDTTHVANSNPDSKVTSTENAADSPDDKQATNIDTWKSVIYESENWFDAIKRREEEEKAEKERLRQEEEDRIQKENEEKEKEELDKKRRETEEQQKRILGEQLLVEEKRRKEAKEKLEKEAAFQAHKLEALRRKAHDAQQAIEQEAEKVAMEALKKRQQEREIARQRQAERKAKLDAILSRVKTTHINERDEQDTDKYIPQEQISLQGHQVESEEEVESTLPAECKDRDQPQIEQKGVMVEHCDDNDQEITDTMAQLDISTIM